MGDMARCPRCQTPHYRNDPCPHEPEPDKRASDYRAMRASFSQPTQLATIRLVGEDDNRITVSVGESSVTIDRRAAKWLHREIARKLLVQEYLQSEDEP